MVSATVQGAAPVSPKKRREFSQGLIPASPLQRPEKGIVSLVDVTVPSKPIGSTSNREQ